MQCHQRNPRAFVVIIDIGDQRRMIQKIRQRNPLLFRLHRGIDEFLKILDSVL